MSILAIPRAALYPGALTSAPLKSHEGVAPMSAKGLILLLLAAAFPLAAVAQAPATPPTEKQTTTPQEMVYGYQLMTDAERSDYRAKMQSLKTQEERDAFRLEHHKKMQERAKERGVTLPEMPPNSGMGMGQHKGSGMGQQKGPGMGQGQPPTQGSAPPPK
jgi:hypothetical protein